MSPQVGSMLLVRHGCFMSQTSLIKSNDNNYLPVSHIFVLKNPDEVYVSICACIQIIAMVLSSCVNYLQTKCKQESDFCFKIQDLYSSRKDMCIDQKLSRVS